MWQISILLCRIMQALIVNHRFFGPPFVPIAFLAFCWGANVWEANDWGANGGRISGWGANGWEDFGRRQTTGGQMAGGKQLSAPQTSKMNCETLRQLNAETVESIEMALLFLF